VLLGWCFLDLRQQIAADGDGWCTFRAVGIAFQILKGRTLVTDSMIQAFQEEGLKQNPNRDEIKCGTRWPEVLAFIRRVCSKKVGFNIKLDFKALSKNLSQGGKGIAALAKCNLEVGIYLLAGHNIAQDAGHCVVLDVEQDRVWVHEDNVSGGLENLDWLHQVSYVRRFKLLDNEPSVPKV